MDELVTQSRNPENTGYVTDNGLREVIKLTAYLTYRFTTLLPHLDPLPAFNEINDPNGIKQAKIADFIRKIIDELFSIRITKNFNLENYLNSKIDEVEKSFDENEKTDILPVIVDMLGNYKTESFDLEHSLSLAENQCVRFEKSNEILSRLNSAESQNESLREILSNARDMLTHFDFNGNLTKDFAIDSLENNFFAVQELIIQLENIEQENLNPEDKIICQDLKSFLSSLNLFLKNQMAPLVILTEPANRNEVKTFFEEITEKIQNPLQREKIVALSQNIDKPTFELSKQIWENAKELGIENSAIAFIATLPGKLEKTVIDKTTNLGGSVSNSNKKAFTTNTNNQACTFAEGFLEQQKTYRKIKTTIENLPQGTSDQRNVKDMLTIVMENMPTKFSLTDQIQTLQTMLEQHKQITHPLAKIKASKKQQKRHMTKSKQK